MGIESSLQESQPRTPSSIGPARQFVRSATNYPGLKLDHLNRLTDDTGMLQHAIFTVPNRAEGYATDDNARALMFTVFLNESDSVPLEPTALANPDWPVRYLAFLEHSFNAENKRFRNFLNYDGRWLEKQGSEDSHGRALWALGTLLGHSSDHGLRGASKRLWDVAVPTIVDFYSPRACAYALLGIAEYLGKYEDRSVQRIQRVLSNRLHEMYRSVQGSEWRWFENVVAYGNARLPQALLAVGAACKDETMISVGLESLEWLMQLQQCRETGNFKPIGSHGFYRRGGEQAQFDQQPLEAAGAISACLQAYRLTRDAKWLLAVSSSFNWFLGANDLKLPLYDSVTGGCRDGLHSDRVNENQGAESTLSFLMALLEIRSFEKTEAPSGKREGFA